MIRKLVALACLVAAVAGCSAAGAEPSGTPHPAWTQADSDKCSEIAIDLLSWQDDANLAEKLYYADQGDITSARKQAAGVAKTYAARLTKTSLPAASTEMAAVRLALLSGATAFAKSMTMPEFEAAYIAIDDAIRAFSNRCTVIDNWVQENVAS